jgi:hypothetical protein
METAVHRVTGFKRKHFLFSFETLSYRFHSSLYACFDCGKFYLREAGTYGK